MGYVYADDAGITINSSCMKDGSCSLDLYKTILVRQDTAGENTAELFVQDIFLGATFFIGTLATFSLMVSGLIMVFGGASESAYEKGKSGMKYSLIGLFLVIISYTAIRMIQFIAQGQR